jgi:hypothetical protein
VAIKGQNQADRRISGFRERADKRHRRRKNLQKIDTQRSIRKRT